MCSRSPRHDRILDYARDLVTDPRRWLPAGRGDRGDGGAARGGASPLDPALGHLAPTRTPRPHAADAAISPSESSSTLLQGHGEPARGRGPQRAHRPPELYRRCVRIGEPVIDVAERVVYAVVKQN